MHFPVIRIIKRKGFANISVRVFYLKYSIFPENNMSIASFGIIYAEAKPSPAVIDIIFHKRYYVHRYLSIPFAFYRFCGSTHIYSGIDSVFYEKLNTAIRNFTVLQCAGILRINNMNIVSERRRGI
ncbi:hypothetical protein SDC9_132820 [bioreactor metagenome]|uniref:Uncharacterized protein n=1 Tax=bioreactor metagenome TaxID=1076179 RepID=A0A645D991_9ZZZZ